MANVIGNPVWQPKGGTSLRFSRRHFPNYPRHDRLAPHDLGKFGLQLRDEGRGAGKGFKI